MQYNDTYATSYDAIIPLIQKQPRKVRGAIIAQLTKTSVNTCDVTQIHMATPSQLLDALLVATGKVTL